MLGEAPRRLGNYPLDRHKTARTISYDVDANWKIIAEKAFDPDAVYHK